MKLRYKEASFLSFVLLSEKPFRIGNLNHLVVLRGDKG